MTLARLLLPLRRIWWFLMDWDTVITYSLPCPRCGESIAYAIRGFWLDHYALHKTKICEYGRRINFKYPPLWWMFWGGWTLRYWDMVLVIRKRWQFRLKYNWGVGVPAECLRGNHQWPEKPNSVYEDNGQTFLVGICERCGFSHRWSAPT